VAAIDTLRGSGTPIRPVLILLAVLISVLATTPLRAGDPLLEPGVPLKNSGQPLEVACHAAPAVTDWNEDGRKDILVGQQTQGLIWLFENVGTDLNPVFNGAVLIESGGVPISTSYL